MSPSSDQTHWAVCCPSHLSETKCHSLRTGQRPVSHSRARRLRPGHWETERPGAVPGPAGAPPPTPCPGFPAPQGPPAPTPMAGEPPASLGRAPPPQPPTAPTAQHPPYPAPTNLPAGWGRCPCSLRSQTCRRRGVPSGPRSDSSSCCCTPFRVAGHGEGSGVRAHPRPLGAAGSLRAPLCTSARPRQD